jgi:hypothetical protein
MLIPPSSQMAPMPDDERARRLASSQQVKEYAQAVDRDSAREMLAKRMATPAADDPGDAREDAEASKPRGRARQEKTTLEKVVNSPLARTVAGAVTRGLMGALLGTPPRRRRRY